MGKMNLKPRDTSKKEAVYGWYPPQWNIYSKPNYKQLDGYDKECLYRQWYNGYKGVPVGSQPFKGPAPPTSAPPPQSPKRQESAPMRHSTPSFQVTRPRSTNSGQALKRHILKREQEKRKQELQLRVDTREAAQSLSWHTPEPEPPQQSPSTILRNSWVFNQPASGYGLRPMEGPDKIPKPDLTHYGFKYGTPTPSEMVETNSRPRSAASPTRPKILSCRPVRSATVRRPKFPSVPTVEKFRQELQRSTTPTVTPPPSEHDSVSPSPSSTDTAIPVPFTESVKKTRKARLKSAPPTVRTPSVPPTARTPTQTRPDSPTPDKEAPPTPELESCRPVTSHGAIVTSPEPQEAEVEKEDSELTYEELVDKYSWKAQIPGDPFGLKKHIIRDRLAFTVTCSAPDGKKDPPKVHREVWDTFFLNTIPRRPMTYTIAPDWVSEVLHAKRMELQKREGITYRCKDYAFAY